MSNTGFRIYTQMHRPPRGLVDSFAGIPVANIADNMNRSFCIDAKIRPFNDKPLLGVAFTVKTRPGDNLLLHKAIDMIQPGDVIVVAGFIILHHRGKADRAGSDGGGCHAVHRRHCAFFGDRRQPDQRLEF